MVLSVSEMTVVSCVSTTIPPDVDKIPTMLLGANESRWFNLLLLVTISVILVIAMLDLGKLVTEASESMNASWDTESNCATVTPIKLVLISKLAIV